MARPQHNGKPQPAERETRYHVPVVRIPQPDGSILIRPGKPVLLGPVEPEVRVREFSRLVGLSVRRVQYLCETGEIKCRRFSKRPGAWYWIPLSEVDRYLSDEP